MATIGRRELLLLLIGVDAQGTTTGSISGLTRLQKFLFLLERQGHIVPTGTGFDFEPYKAGPYSSKLYDDLELLENLRLIRSEATAESTMQESVDINHLSFEELIGGFEVVAGSEEFDGVSLATDSFEERRFALTEEGLKRIQKFLQDEEYSSVIDGIKRIKSKYSNYSLRDLLRYVYSKYPEMTTESEIIREVLGSRHT
jgi:uncharacterized protein YwgA